MAGYTQAQLDALDAAIAQGATHVRYGDKQVQYRSLDEMLRLRSLIRRELGLEIKDQKTFPTFSKGF
jgi:hypothetical protein